MSELAKWECLKAISELKREAQEESRKGKYRVRKAVEAEAEALAKMETGVQWEIRKDADAFLKAHGYTSGGKRKGARKVPGL